LLKSGDKLGGKYRLERLLGQGAAGAVWLGVNETIGRDVAIKVLREDGRQKQSIRFLQEAKLVAQIHSRHVVSIYDFGATAEGILYMVMERLHGETLGARLRRVPLVRVQDLLRHVAEILSGLDQVHRNGIVHRDLKPENVFLVEEPGELYAKILDFGVSRSEDPSVLGPDISKVTQTGMTVGTPLYMAPEQARGRRDIDGRTDLYAVGVIVYKALTGDPPYDDTNVVELLLKVAHAEKAPALHERRPDLGHALSDFLQRAMAPRREDRFPDALEMRNALLEAARGLPPGAVCAASKGPPTEEKIPLDLQTLVPPPDLDATFSSAARTRKSRRLLFATAAIAVIAAAAGMFVASAATKPAARPAVTRPPAVVTTPLPTPPPVAPAVAAEFVEARSVRPVKEPRRARKKPVVRAKAKPAPDVFQTPDF
jgi:serine/threonine-protein kinase